MLKPTNKYYIEIDTLWVGDPVNDDLLDDGRGGVRLLGVGLLWGWGEEGLLG